MVKNRALAAAYAGAHRFGVEVFEPATSNVLMAALLVHDLHTDGGPGHAHPWQDEAYAAVHGGLWRRPYAPRSALGLAALLGLRRRPGLNASRHRPGGPDVRTGRAAQGAGGAPVSPPRAEIAWRRRLEPWERRPLGPLARPGFVHSGRGVLTSPPVEDSFERRRCSGS